MKNLPEHEAFKALENRLNNYTEQPEDDLWQKIAADLPTRKPVWSPWMNQFAAIVAVAALGWALGYRSAQDVGNNTLAVSPPKSASVERVAPGRAAGSPIHPEHAAAKDALPQAGREEPAADAFTSKKSTRSNQGSAASLPLGAGSGLDSNASGTPSLNQPSSGSARDRSPDFDSQTGTRTAARQVRGSSPASSIFPTSNEHRDAPVQRDQGAQQTEAKMFDAVGAISHGTAKQEPSIHNLSSNDLPAIKPPDGTTSATPASTQHPQFNLTARDSSQQEGVLTHLTNADSAVTDGQKTPYNRPKKKRTGISIYALFSPTLSFQTATPSARDGVIIQKLNKSSILSGDRLGLALEAGVQGRLSKKFEYFAGLSVYHQSQTLRYTYQNSGNFVIENGADDLSYTVKPTVAERSVSYTMLNAGAQAGVLYTLKEHRLSHKIGVALQYQKGLAHASEGEPYDNASSSYLNYQVLYRAELALHDRLTFIVQPSVTRTWLVNETLHVPFTLKQYRPGVSIGLSYRLMR